MSCNKVCHVIKMVCRYLLGAMCLLFGLNKFLGFMAMPPFSEPAQNLMNALLEAGYFMPTLGFVFITVGLALLSGYFVPLALVVLFPVSVNTFFFHLFLDPAGIGGAAVLTSLNVILLIKYKKAYCKLFQPKCCCKGSCEVPQQ